MPLLLALILAVLYLALTHALIGVLAAKGMMFGWIFGPAMMAVATGLVAEMVTRSLPLPWESGAHYGRPPRAVHFSWRAAAYLPAWAPWLLVPANGAWQLRAMGWGPGGWTAWAADGWVPSAAQGWVPWAALGVALAVAVAMMRVTFKVRREIRLLRNGQVIMALTHPRRESDSRSKRVFFRFTTFDGTPVSGSGRDLRYRVPVGTRVPVFYDLRNPENYVVACGSWFEAR